MKKKYPIKSYWGKWYEISEKQFENMVWKAAFSATTLNDLIEICGTLHIALRILKVFKKANLVTVQDNHVIFDPALFELIPYQEKISAQEPEHLTNDIQFGQFRATWDSSIRRAEIIHQALPNHREIFFIGDDDFTSVALANYRSMGIYVGDIDEGIVKRIKEEADCLTTAIYDVRDEVAPDFKHRFDAIHCDPIDDGRGLDLWLHRANQLLKGEKGDLLFLNVSVKRLGSRVVFLQSFLNSLGFYLQAIHSDLNLYRVKEEPAIEETKIKGELNEIGFSETVFDQAYITTDLLVFARMLDRPLLLPQDVFEIRRKI